MFWLAIDDVIALMSNSVCFGLILLEVRELSLERRCLRKRYLPSTARIPFSWP